MQAAPIISGSDVLDESSRPNKLSLILV
jgi:hypothetical protein